MTRPFGPDLFQPGTHRPKGDMAEIVVNGVRTVYEEFGTGEPIVLVHGLGGTGTDTWKKVIAPLAQDYRVIVYDLRGSGKSDVPPGPYSVELLADDLGALVTALGLDRVALMGHSLGGGIVLRHAASRPDGVRALVAVGAVARPLDQAKAGLETRATTVESDGMAAVAETVATSGLAPSFREAHPEEFQELISLLASNKTEGYAAQCRALVAMTDDHLPQINAPVLVVCGELDQASPPAMNHENAARLPNATLVEVADCAHHIQWERPDELLAAARPFLRANS